MGLNGGMTPSRMRHMGVSEGMQAPANAMSPSFGQPDDMRRQQLAQLGMQFGQQMMQRNQMPALTPQAPALMQQPQAPAMPPAMATRGGMMNGGLAGLNGQQFGGYQPRPAFRKGIY